MEPNPYSPILLRVYTYYQYTPDPNSYSRILLKVYIYCQYTPDPSPYSPILLRVYIYCQYIPDPSPYSPILLRVYIYCKHTPDPSPYSPILLSSFCLYRVGGSQSPSTQSPVDPPYMGMVTWPAKLGYQVTTWSKKTSNFDQWYTFFYWKQKLKIIICIV